MSATVTVDEALDAVERLPDEQQADLVDVVRRRLALRCRERILADIREAEAEHAAGRSREGTVKEIMREIAE
jgi:hypothetical protein